jgi:hypothetical protein
MYHEPTRIDEYVAIVPVLDLQDVAHDRVGHEAPDEVESRPLVALLAEPRLEDVPQALALVHLLQVRNREGVSNELYGVTIEYL